jgi:hypothetical protein
VKRQEGLEASNSDRAGSLHTVLKDKDMGEKEVRGSATTATRLLGHLTKYGRGNEFLTTSFGIRRYHVGQRWPTMLVGWTTTMAVV